MTLRSVRESVISYIMLTSGAIIGALSVVVFLLPFDIAPSGVSGIGVFLNHFFGLPVGMMVLLLNIPIQILGLRMLPSGWQMVMRTVYTIVVYSVALDVLGQADIFPPDAISDNVLLMTIFGGVTGGLSTGIIFRAGGSFGGTSTIAMILQRRINTPMSTTFLYTDTLIIGIAALIFGWEQGLLAMTALFLGGVATDYVMEGPSVIRIGVIITNKPQDVSQVILQQLRRGVTAWEGRGMYSGEMRSVLYVTIPRSQVNELRRLVNEADPKAFLVIGQGHAAYGEGFRPIGRK